MNQSPSIANLAAALVEAQKKFAPAVKAKANPAFKGSKYVDLASAIDAAQPALLENGIAVIQGTAGDVAQQSITVTTRILHSSGEWIEDSLTLPAVNRADFTAQSAGSAITYARRYSYMAILGFAPEDDDGNAASQPGHHEGPQTITQVVLSNVRFITNQQRDEFWAIAKDKNKTKEEVTKALAAAGIQASGKIPASDFKQWCEWLRGESEVPA